MTWELSILAVLAVAAVAVIINEHFSLKKYRG